MSDDDYYYYHYYYYYCYGCDQYTYKYKGRLCPVLSRPVITQNMPLVLLTAGCAPGPANNNQQQPASTEQQQPTNGENHQNYWDDDVWFARGGIGPAIPFAFTTLYEREPRQTRYDSSFFIYNGKIDSTRIPDFLFSFLFQINFFSFVFGEGLNFLMEARYMAGDRVVL